MGKQHYTEADVQGAIHQAMQRAITGYQPNSETSLAAGVRMQMAAAIAGGYDFADTLHNIYLDYGYPATLTFFNFWNMYRRFGVARRAVDLYADQTWLDDPIITSGNPQFERDLKKLVGTGEDGTVTRNSVGLWRRLRGLDARQRVGRYGGMFMRVKDGKQPSEPLEGKLPGLNALVEMVPLYESQLRVLTTESDPASENFGQPTMYQYSGNVTGNRNERSSAAFDIHPSRVVIAAEGSDNGGIYGIPVLESVYNDLMDLRKILGGGAEGFYKNAAQSVVFNLTDASSAAANEKLLDKFNDKYDDFAQNRQRRALWTPGMEAKVLDSNLVSSDPFVQGSLLAIAAGVNIPVSLLVGNQTGRLAGDQDTRGFLGQVQSRRVDWGTEMITSVIDWCIDHGVLPSAPYGVEWPDAQAPSMEQKLSNADKMASINERQFKSGGDLVFSGEEIREEAGFDPEEIEEMPPTEGLDDDNDEGDE